MAPRKLRPVDDPPRGPDTFVELDDNVLDDLLDVVEQVDSLRGRLDPAMRRAFDHAVVDLRHHADTVRDLFQRLGPSFGARS